MKHALLTSSLAVCLASSAIASENPPKTSISPEVRLALDYLEHEMDARLMPPAKQPIRLDQPSSRAISESEKAALRKVFGTEQALDIRRLPGKGPQTVYSVRIPGHAIGEGDERSEWQELNARYSFDASGKRYSANGMWPGIKAQNKDETIAVGTVRFQGQETRDPNGLWLGKTHVDADHAAIQSKTSPYGVRWEQITFDSNSKRNGKNIDIVTELGAKQMLVGDTVIEQQHLAIKLRGLDADTLKTFSDEARKLRTAEQPEKEAETVTQKLTLNMFKTLALKGARIEMSDFSGSYQGARVQIKGYLSAPGLSEADLTSPDKVLAKLDAQLDVSLPLPILHAIARGIARIGNDKAGTDRLREQDAYDFMLGKLIGSGYARMDKDKLIAHLEVKGGMLRVTDNIELIPLKTLLDALNQQGKQEKKNEPDFPPADHGAPVSVTWRDRRLESVVLYAGNGEARAIDELCYRYTHGDHAPKDTAEAERWCARSKNPPNLSDGDRHSDDPSVYQLSADPAYFSARYVRFDENKSRELELTLSQPGKDEEYWPMISVCLLAEAPSQFACVKISPQQKGTIQPLRAEVSLRSTDNKSEKTGTAITDIQAENGQLKLRAYVRDQKAHFVINDTDELEQPILFPVELIQLGCSTADCRFKFN